MAVSCFYACKTGSTAGLAAVVTTWCIKMAGWVAAAPQTAKFDTTLESVPTRQTAASRAGGAVVLPRPPTHSIVPLYRAVPPTLPLSDLLIHSLSTFFPRLLRTSQLRCHRRRVLSPPCLQPKHVQVTLRRECCNAARERTLRVGTCRDDSESKRQSKWPPQSQWQDCLSAS